MNQELISIIIPVYNVEKYLNNCIKSIVNQTYKNLEIIIVDDGSTDNSLSILKEWEKADKRIRLFHKENGGLSSARNMGIEKSTGTLLMFVDSDDYIDLMMTEIMYNQLKNDDSDLCICNLYYLFDNYKKIGAKLFFEKKVFDVSNKFDLLFGDTKKISVMACNKLYKRKLFECLRYPINKINEDEYVIFDLINKSNRISFINKPLYYYVQRSNSIMHSFNIKRFEVNELLNERTQLFINSNLPIYAQKNEIFSYLILLDNLYLYKNSNNYDNDTFNYYYSKLINKKKTIKKYNFRFLDLKNKMRLYTSFLSFDLYCIIKRVW